MGTAAFEPFARRLFIAFDMDNDGLVHKKWMQINFNDFAEYSDILRKGCQRDRAYLSFRMFDVAKRGYITRNQVSALLRDYLRAWQSLANAPVCKPSFACSFSDDRER